MIREFYLPMTHFTVKYIRNFGVMQACLHLGREIYSTQNKK